LKYIFTYKFSKEKNFFFLLESPTTTKIKKDTISPFFNIKEDTIKPNLSINTNNYNLDNRFSTKSLGYIDEKIKHNKVNLDNLKTVCKMTFYTKKSKLII
jgi:hypothetical protein